MLNSTNSGERNATVFAEPGWQQPTRCPVLALHCSGGGAYQWKSWQAAAKDQVQIIAPALLGYTGPTAWDPESRVDLCAEALAIAPLLGDQPGGVDLVGHSYGGAVAIELAVRFPTRIRSLTLYEPVRFSMLKKFGDPEWHEIADVASSMLKLALSGSHDASSERFVDYWSGAGTWAKLPDPARQAVRLRTAKVCAEFEALFSDEISLDQIGQLSMPVRLLSGTQSPRPVLRVVDRLADVLPGAKRIRLPGLGHMGPLLDPARVMDATGLFA